MKHDIEYETKLVGWPGFVMPDFSTLGDVSLVSLPESHVVNVYFDTVDLRLLQHGVSLRRSEVTPAGFDGWILKVPLGAATDASIDVPEIGRALYTAPMSTVSTSLAVPSELLELLLPISLDHELVAVAELRTRRTTTQLVHDQVVLASISVDEVSVVHAGRVVERFAEIEVERGSHALSAVAHAAVQLLRTRGARPVLDGSKIARALGPRLEAVQVDDLGQSLGVISRTLRHSVGVLCTSAFVAGIEPSTDNVESLAQAARRVRAQLGVVGDALAHDAMRVGKHASDIVDASDLWLALDDQHQRLERDEQRGMLSIRYASDVGVYLDQAKATAMQAIRELFGSGDACVDVGTVADGVAFDHEPDMSAAIQRTAGHLLALAESVDVNPIELGVVAEQLLASDDFDPGEVPQNIRKRVVDLVESIVRETRGVQLRRVFDGQTAASTLAYPLGVLTGLSARRVERAVQARVVAQQRVASGKLSTWLVS